MYAKKQLIYTVLGLIFFFLLGWKTAEYHFAGNTRPEENILGGNFENSTNGQKVNMSLFWDVWDE